MKISRERIQATAAVLFAALATAMAFVAAYNVPRTATLTPHTANFLYRCLGCHGREEAAGLAYHWTRPQTIIDMPHPGGEQVRLGLTLAAGENRQVPLWLGSGAGHAEILVDAWPRQYEVLIPTDPYDLRLRFYLVAPALHERAEAGGRSLGVILGSEIVVWSDGPPPLLLTLPLVGVVLAWYLVLRAPRMKIRYALLLTLPLVVLLIVGLRAYGWQPRLAPLYLMLTGLGLMLVRSLITGPSHVWLRLPSGQTLTLPRMARDAGSTVLYRPYVLALLFINAAAIAAPLLLVSNPRPHFVDEGGFITLLSFFHLYAIGCLAASLYAVRRAAAERKGWQQPYWLWFLVALGFMFLALDEILEIHEYLDVYLHNALHLQETMLTDRLDDIIPALYGLAGLGVLVLYRAELLHYRRLLPLVLAGGVLAGASVVLDLLTNFDAAGRELLPPVIAAVFWELTMVEEICKLLAVAVFLGAMFRALEMTSVQVDSSSMV
jgi:hypothetical protein